MVSFPLKILTQFLNGIKFLDSFDLVDANNDGKLSEKELNVFMRKRGRPDGKGKGTVVLEIVRLGNL